MPMIPHFMSNSVDVTPEMRSAASASVEQTIADTKAIMMKLDIPSTAFPQVLELYENYLCGQRMVADHVQMKERAKRQRAKMIAKYGTANIGQMVPGIGYAPSMPFDDLDDED